MTFESIYALEVIRPPREIIGPIESLSSFFDFQFLNNKNKQVGMHYCNDKCANCFKNIMFMFIRTCLSLFSSALKSSVNSKMI